MLFLQVGYVCSYKLLAFDSYVGLDTYKVREGQVCMHLFSLRKSDVPLRNE